MLRPLPALSNAERQRRFRARHPGYYNRPRRLKAERMKAKLREARAAAQALLAAASDADVGTPPEPFVTLASAQDDVVCAYS